MRNNLLLFFSALSIWYVLNEYNLSYARSVNSTFYGVINVNSDILGYTNQIHNMLDGHGFTFDPKDNPEMAVRRTPGYPFFYGIHYLLSHDEESSFWVIRYTQLLLFALSCVLLSLLVFNYTEKKRWAQLAGWTYAFSPFTPIYTYTVMTESVSPFLVILVLYLASLYHKNKTYKTLYLTGLAVSVLFLTRPVLGVLLPAIFLSFVHFRKLFQADYFKKVFVEGLVYGLGFATLVGPWVVRNYIVTGGEIVVAESFYHEAPMNFGRQHFYFRALNSAWTNTGSGKCEILADQFRLYAARGTDEEADKAIQQYVESQPPYVYDIISRQDFENLLHSLYACYVEMYQYQQANPTHNREQWVNIACQFENKEKALALTKEFKEKAAIQYYFITPIKALLRYGAQSNTHHIKLLNPKDRNFAIWQKALKGICLLLNLFLFLSLFCFLFTKTETNLKIIFGISVGLVVLALLWALRHVENRYFIPIIPMAHITLAYFLAKIWDWWDVRRAKE